VRNVWNQNCEGKEAWLMRQQVVSVRWWCFHSHRPLNSRVWGGLVKWDIS